MSVKKMFLSEINTTFQSEGIIVLNNRDFNSDQNNRDYHLVRNGSVVLGVSTSITAGGGSVVGR